MNKKVEEIIDIIYDYHSGLSKYFASLKDEAADERTNLLIEHLSNEERFLAEYLEKYKDVTQKRILNTWVKYVPWLPSNIFCKCRAELGIIEGPLESFDILNIVWHFNECLIQFYETLVLEIQNVEVGEVFRNLLRVTKKLEMNLSRDVSWLHDL